MQPFAIETSTVGLTLWNPTDEDLDMQYSGLSLTMKAGEIQVFEINCAKHLLNGFGQRGLTSLVFGCDDKTKRGIGEAARKRNIDFKTRMVTDYNQRNANRKQMGLGYLPSSEKVREYASTIGIKLDDPYSVRDPERDRTEVLETENKRLNSEIVGLKVMMENFINDMKKDKEAPVIVPKK
jgi:hypothetical protein